MEGRGGKGQKIERKEMKRETVSECFTPTFALTNKPKAPHLSSHLPPPPSSPPLQWSPLMSEALC